jgi:hypothetical protein
MFKAAMVLQPLPVEIEGGFHPSVTGLSNSDDAPMHEQNPKYQKLWHIKKLLYNITIVVVA